jgi:AcrR family transcriptional regulator
VPEKAQTETVSKRDLILEAAGTLFAQKGYEETTIADIAKAARIAVGTVYLYFHNKYEIYTAVALNMEAFVAEAFNSPDVVGQPFSQIPRAMVNALFRSSRERMHLIFFLQVDAGCNEEVMQHKHAHQSITDTLAAIFQRAIDRGELAPFNTKMYAQMLDLMGGSVLHQCFAVEKGEREEMYRAYMIEFIERLFFGPSLKEGDKSQG